jgi:hypothetical protein
MQIAKVGEDVFASRFSSCKPCEHFDSAAFQGGGKCLACGCPVQTKLRLASSACPIGRWGAAGVAGEADKSTNTPPVDPESPLPPPSVSSMARSFFESATKFVASGFPRTPIEALQVRVDTCGACEHWDSSGFGGTGQCKVCGCSTQVKLRMATTECPIGRWKAIK